MVELVKQYDYFISHTKNEVDWAMWIAWCLDEAGFTTFVRGKDVPVGASEVGTIRKAITVSEHIVLLLSPEYLSDSEVASDLDIAMRRLQGGRKAALLPIEVRECHDWLRNDYEDLNNVKSFKLFDLDEAKAKNDLLSHIPRHGSLIKPPRYSQRPQFPGANQLQKPMAAQNPSIVKPSVIPSPIISSRPSGLQAPLATRQPIQSGAEVLQAPIVIGQSTQSSAEVLQTPIAAGQSTQSSAAVLQTSVATGQPMQSSAEVLQAPVAAGQSTPSSAEVLQAPVAAGQSPQPKGASLRGTILNSRPIQPWFLPEPQKRYDIRPIEGSTFISRSPDGRFIAIGLGDREGILRILITQTGGIRSLRHQKKPPAEGKVTALAWSYDNKRLASAYWNHDQSRANIEIWDIENGKFLLSCDGPDQHKSRIRALAWSYDGQYLASAGQKIMTGTQDDTGVRVWKTDTGAYTYTCTSLGKKEVASLAWSPNGGQVAAGISDSVEVWAHPNGAWDDSFTCTLGTGPISTLAWSRDGQYLAAANKMLNVWDAIAHRSILTYQQEDDHYINTLLWSTDNVSLLWAGDDAMLHTWNALDSKQRHTKIAFQDSHLSIREVALIFDHQHNPYLIAAACSDGIVRFWDVKEVLL